MMLANPFRYRTCHLMRQNDHIRLRAYRKDHITRTLKKGNFYEGDFLDMIAEKYAANGLFVDVGAFVGNHAIFFAKFCKADQVIAFEPFPETFALLRYNIRMNGLKSKITPINKALSDSAGSLKMAVVSQTNRGMNRIDATGTVHVEVSTLDTELASKTLPVSFLKIDAEGHGAKVILGAKSIIDRDRPVIAIEIDEEPGHETVNLLSGMGYIAKSCHNGTPTWIFEHHERT